jgi:serine protease Do
MNAGLKLPSSGSKAPDDGGKVALKFSLLLGLALLPSVGAAVELAEVVQSIKPSIVAVGTFQVLRGRQRQPRGSGFVVAGNHVVTNSHVVPAQLDEARRESLAVFIPGSGHRAEMRKGHLVVRDEEHDLALIRFEGDAMKSVTLGRMSAIREGGDAAFTGFPVLGALGLHPATHRATIAALSPVVRPVERVRDLSPEVITRLSKPFEIIQLDATAYPGSSGSPLYLAGSGKVIGVVNSVYVKKTKELAISDPSGISYAIPVSYIRALLRKAGLRF